MKFRNAIRNFCTAAVGGALSVMAGVASATTGPTMDVSAAEAFLTGDVMAAVGLLGGAGLIVAIAVKGWKKARSAA